MNPLSWLSPGRWLLYAAFVGALALGAWRVHHVIDKGGYDRAEAEYTAAALKASEAARAKEQELITKNQKVANDYINEKKRRAADSVISAGRLRDLQAVLSSPSGTDTTTIGGIDATYRTIIDQCSIALTELDKHDQDVAAKATALQQYISSMLLSR